MTVNQKEECKIRERERERQRERETEHIPSWTNPEPKIDNRAENSSQKHSWRRSEHSDTVWKQDLCHEDIMRIRPQVSLALFSLSRVLINCDRGAAEVSAWCCVCQILDQLDSKGITGGFYSYHYNINILKLVDTFIIVLRLNGRDVQCTVKSVNKTHTLS